MKKIFHVLALALVLIPTTSALAGDDDDKQFYKGIRVGWQQSNFSDSEWGDLSSFYVGFFGVKKIGTGKLLSMYTGLEYYETGASDNENNQIKLGYLSLPINLRLKLGPVYGFAGLNPSFKIVETAKAAGIDVSDQLDVNVFDIGGQVGIGAKILFFGAEIKYNQGFANVYSNLNGDNTTTHHLQAGLCVYF